MFSLLNVLITGYSNLSDHNQLDISHLTKEVLCYKDSVVFPSYLNLLDITKEVLYKME